MTVAANARSSHVRLLRVGAVTPPFAGAADD
jgi:hypothetical protein